MIVHVVLFSPRPDLSGADRAALVGALELASKNIPSIKRLRIGTRIKHSLPGYEQMMHDDYEYAVFIEFDDVEGLKAYLRHPAHAAAGHHFMASASKALAYDYEVAD
ncbi:MAG TPA: Dabb family protein [Vicinamibacterales bacterium]|jgi:stress responsive alpha/beta barrel protein|nr:Dabb family protein [Vicinamibacterales bacterium]